MRLFLFTLALTFISLPAIAQEPGEAATVTDKSMTLEQVAVALQKGSLAGTPCKPLLESQAAKNYPSWEKAATDGDAAAQYVCGLCNLMGIGSEQDPEKSTEWFRKSAEQDYASSALQYGLAFQSGIGVEPDSAEAIKWLRKAKELGSIEAVHDLGFCYYEGTGVPQDSAEAIRLFKQSADAGYANAKNTLGICYMYGSGVPQDSEEGLRWLTSAAEQGLAAAQNSLGAMYYQGQGVAEDPKNAAKWFRMAAEQGNSTGQYHLGMCYEDGVGVESDLDEARAWYAKAAEVGHEQAKEALNRIGHSAAEGKHLQKLVHLFQRKLLAKQMQQLNMNRRVYAAATGGSDQGISSIREDMQRIADTESNINEYIANNKKDVLPALERIANEAHPEIASEAKLAIRSTDWPEEEEQKENE